MTVLVGVDVGGSGLRCQTLVGDAAGEVLSAPGVRIDQRGIDVQALVESVVPLVAHDADVLVWSMRGLLALADPAAVLLRIKERVSPRQTAVCGDALAAMVGAVGGVRTGAVVAAGSGAVAFATDFDDVWRRIDGWGHVLGDRGSSAWVGLRALETALQTYDGVTSDGTALLEAATARLGDPETWPRTVMTRPDVVAVVAGLAPDVTALAPTDGAAARICAAAGRELASSLAAAASGLDAVRVSRTGGLFSATPIREAFDAEASVLGLDVQPPAGTGLDGALHLARRLADGPALPLHPAYLILG